MTASLHHSLPELAREAGISESTARRYVKTFASFLRFEDKGRIRLYRPECIQVLKRIKSLYDQGHDTDQVHDQLDQEYDRIIEQDPSADGGGQPPAYQGADAREIALELVNAIKRNDQLEHDISKLKGAVHTLASHIKQMKGEQKALPDSYSMEEVLYRLSLLEQRVAALENDRNKSWWRKLTRKKDGFEGGET